MIVYRLAIELYKGDLSGAGSKIFGGRWNLPGLPVIYTAENISLAVLEILVNVDKNSIPPAYYLLKIQVPDELLVKKIAPSKLKEKWYTDVDYSQFIGTNFLRSGKEAILKVPSAVVKEEHNFLLNPTHKEFSKITIIGSAPFDMDIRLLKTNE